MCQSVAMVQVNGGLCGVKHHYLLHGSSSRFCNYLRASQGTRVVPSKNDVQLSQQRITLLQVQWVPLRKMYAKSRKRQPLTLWDSVSIVTIIRHWMVEAEVWKGYPVELELTTTGGKLEQWKTIAYWILLINKMGQMHKVLAYAMEHITMTINYVEVKGLAK